MPAQLRQWRARWRTSSRLHQRLDTLVNGSGEFGEGAGPRMGDVEEILAEIGHLRGIEVAKQIDDRNAQLCGGFAGGGAAHREFFKKLRLIGNRILITCAEPEAG